MNKHRISKFILSAAFLGAGFMNAQAADETIRQLAKERGRFIGTILNSEWFNDDIEPEFEEIHKTQFNVVVAENEMKFDATEPKEDEFNFEKGDKMVKYAQANGLPPRSRTRSRLAQPSRQLGEQLQRTKRKATRRPQKPYHQSRWPLERPNRRMGCGERSRQ